jgi:RNA polymerase sigma-70 factor (ECF subfamily)
MINDILHDVYVKVFVYCKRYDFSCEKAGVKNLRSWIFQVCHNAMIDRLKTNAKYAYPSGRLPDTIDECCDAENENINITNLINRLPKKYADIIYMDTVLNINQSTIASRLGLGISATKSRIQRGKQMLRDIYLKEQTNQ